MSENLHLCFDIYELRTCCCDTQSLENVVEAGLVIVLYYCILYSDSLAQNSIYR